MRRNKRGNEDGGEMRRVGVGNLADVERGFRLRGVKRWQRGEKQRAGGKELPCLEQTGPPRRPPHLRPSTLHQEGGQGQQGLCWLNILRKVTPHLKSIYAH